MGAIASTEMSNRQVIAIFIVGLGLLLTAFWAGLSVIKDEASLTKPGAGNESAPLQRQPGEAAIQQQEPAAGDNPKYEVVVAAFGTLTQAKQLESDLKAKYLSVRVIAPSGQETLYRVAMGPYDDKRAADQIANELASEGRKGIMILSSKGD